MAIEIVCPDCRTRLTVADDRAGGSANCPECHLALTVPTPGAAPPPPRDRYRERDRDDSDEDYLPPRRRRSSDDRRWTEPHRGSMILVFGILSLVVCAPFGIAAWVMGASDLNAMRSGRMDPSGEGVTRAGYVCGIIGTALLAVSVIVIVMWLAAFNDAVERRR